MKLGLRWGSATALLFAGAAWADDPDLSPEKVGQIQYQEKQALDRVNKEYGDRKPSELSQEERRDQMKRQQEELTKVHESAGVSDKDYARYTAHMNADDRATAKATQQQAEKAEIKKEVKAEEEKAKGPEVVPYDSVNATDTSTRAAPPSANKAKKLTASVGHKKFAQQEKLARKAREGSRRRSSRRHDDR